VTHEEKRFLKFAKTLTGDDWRNRVEQIADRDVRIAAANIVWWDFFGDRKATDPWTQLDDYKTAWKPNQRADVQAVRNALVFIGYPQSMALKRVKPEDQIDV